MIGPKVLMESENYRVIERVGEPGRYLVQQKVGIWRAVREYGRANNAIKKAEMLEKAWTAGVLERRAEWRK